MSRAVSNHTDLYESDEPNAVQRERFLAGEVPVAIYGLGKMGLPLAAVYADVTGNTVGVDIDPDVVQAVNAGESPVHREPGLDDLVSTVVETGSLRATRDGTRAAASAAIHVVMVPTLLTHDRKPDLSILESVLSTIASGLSVGDLVIIESTVPPRTTTDLVVPQLASESGIDGFGVAVCPERTVSGEAIANIRGTHPKIVGGIDEESTRVAALIYNEITINDVIPTVDTTTAEAVKVFEGVYRDVNIALANQLAMFAKEMDIDVTAAIELANTQPFCDIHNPGPGVGGHCIPVYPYFLSEQFEADASLLTAARQRNDAMPEFTVAYIQEVLTAYDIDPAQASVLLMGVTYKANIRELRNSPAIPIATEMTALGAQVFAVDPLVTEWEDLETMEPLTMATAMNRTFDVVVLLTPHDDFATLDWNRFGAPIVDGRGSINADTVDTPVYRIGGRWP